MGNHANRTPIFQRPAHEIYGVKSAALTCSSQSVSLRSYAKAFKDVGCGGIFGIARLRCRNIARAHLR